MRVMAYQPISNCTLKSQNIGENDHPVNAGMKYGQKNDPTIVGDVIVGFAAIDQ